jgi:hypothetical protein
MLLSGLELGRFPQIEGLDKIFGALRKEGIPQGLKPLFLFAAGETRA